jgi:hypothetical protein
MAEQRRRWIFKDHYWVEKTGGKAYEVPHAPNLVPTSRRRFARAAGIRGVAEYGDRAPKRRP